MLHARVDRRDSPSLKLAWVMLLGLILIGLVSVDHHTWAIQNESGQARDRLFDNLEFSPEVQERYWAAPEVQALLKLEEAELAAWVPEQAGLFYCRCPECGLAASEDPLTWSPEDPEHLRCRSCEARFPNESIPAKVKGQVPEQTLEVLGRQIHHYPYHAVEPVEQRYPGERIYLDAKRDDVRRRELVRLAFWSAIRHHHDPDPDLARRACLLLLRFAQVYPAYAIHDEAPGRLPILHRADLRPPYRRDGRMAKWDRDGLSNIPLELVIVYDLLRDGPALIEAASALDVVDPHRLVETFLIDAAEFARAQPELYQSSSLGVIRGLLAVGRVLDRADLIQDALARLDELARQGFYHDGLWRGGVGTAHDQVLEQLDGWFERLLPQPSYLDTSARSQAWKMQDLARRARHIPLRQAGLTSSARPTDVEGPSVSPLAQVRPALLGGAGLARLGTGRGASGFDLELRGLSNLSTGAINRLTLRAAVSGQMILGDLDDLPPQADGWDLATTSHSTVTVDQLNQGESLPASRQPAPGSDIRYFAADENLQVVQMTDRFAYPRLTSRYRRTVVLVNRGAGRSYAVDLFEVHGGTAHDTLFHAWPGYQGRWRVPTEWHVGPRSLLPETIPFVPQARAEDGRWFVQGYAAFEQIQVHPMIQPVAAELMAGPDQPGLRVHLLGPLPSTLIRAVSPDPVEKRSSTASRASLILRRQSQTNAPLTSMFVSVLEPTGPGWSRLERVDRLPGPLDVVVLQLNLAGQAAPDYLVIQPDYHPSQSVEVRLRSGHQIRTDGLAVLVSPESITLAGGTLIQQAGSGVEDREVRHPWTGGRVVDVVDEQVDRGWARGGFLVEGSIEDPRALLGRVLIIRHGDGIARGWTITGVQPEGAEGTPAQIRVLERPGFHIDPRTGSAHYDQFPHNRSPGPHDWVVSQITTQRWPRQVVRGPDGRSPASWPPRSVRPILPGSSPTVPRND